MQLFMPSLQLFMPPVPLFTMPRSPPFMSPVRLSHPFLATLQVTPGTLLFLTRMNHLAAHRPPSPKQPRITCSKGLKVCEGRRRGMEWGGGAKEKDDLGIGKSRRIKGDFGED